MLRSFRCSMQVAPHDNPTPTPKRSVYHRIFVAASVMAAGVGLAWPFRTQHGQTFSKTANTNLVAPALTIPLQISGESPAPLASPVGSTANETTVYLTTHRDSESAPTDRFSETAEIPRPTLSAHVPAAEESVPPVRPITRTTVARPQEKEVEESPWRTHWIIDGDSLEKLAKRFLGDESRWREIRDANRDILPADDVLPIGKELRIPPKTMPATVTEPGSQLVPIPWDKNE